MPSEQTQRRFGSSVVAAAVVGAGVVGVVVVGAGVVGVVVVGAGVVVVGAGVVVVGAGVVGMVVVGAGVVVVGAGVVVVGGRSGRGRFRGSRSGFCDCSRFHSGGGRFCGGRRRYSRHHRAATRPVQAGRAVHGDVVYGHLVQLVQTAAAENGDLPREENSESAVLTRCETTGGGLRCMRQKHITEPGD